MGHVFSSLNRFAKSVLGKVRAFFCSDTFHWVVIVVSVFVSWYLVGEYLEKCVLMQIPNLYKRGPKPISAAYARGKKKESLWGRINLWRKIQDYFKEKPEEKVKLEFEDVDSEPTSDEAALSWKRAFEILRFGAPSMDDLRLYENFVVCYNKQKRMASWVYYDLHKRKNPTKIDKEDHQYQIDKPRGDVGIHEYFRTHHGEFKIPGFTARQWAHLEDQKGSTEAARQSLFTTNMVHVRGSLPSPKAGFWRIMEQHCRELAEIYKNVYVCTGPLYLPKKEADGNIYVKYEVVGFSHIAVPTHVFMVIFAEDHDRKVEVWSYVMPNKVFDAKKKSPEDFYVDLVTLEKASGLFFTHGVSKSAFKKINGKPVPDDIDDNMYEPLTIEDYMSLDISDEKPRKSTARKSWDFLKKVLTWPTSTPKEHTEEKSSRKSADATTPLEKSKEKSSAKSQAADIPIRKVEKEVTDYQSSTRKPPLEKSEEKIKTHVGKSQKDDSVFGFVKKMFSYPFSGPFEDDTPTEDTKEKVSETQKSIDADTPLEKSKDKISQTADTPMETSEKGASGDRSSIGRLPLERTEEKASAKTQTADTPMEKSEKRVSGDQSSTGQPPLERTGEKTSAKTQIADTPMEKSEKRVSGDRSSIGKPPLERTEEKTSAKTQTADIPMGKVEKGVADYQSSTRKPPLEKSKEKIETHVGKSQKDDGVFGFVKKMFSYPFSGSFESPKPTENIKEKVSETQKSINAITPLEKSKVKMSQTADTPMKKSEKGVSDKSFTTVTPMDKTEEKSSENQNNMTTVTPMDGTEKKSSGAIAPVDKTEEKSVESRKFHAITPMKENEEKPPESQKFSTVTPMEEPEETSRSFRAITPMEQTEEKSPESQKFSTIAPTEKMEEKQSESQTFSTVTPMEDSGETSQNFNAIAPMEETEEKSCESPKFSNIAPMERTEEIPSENFTTRAPTDETKEKSTQSFSATTPREKTVEESFGRQEFSTPTPMEKAEEKPSENHKFTTITPMENAEEKSFQSFSTTAPMEETKKKTSESQNFGTVTPMEEAEENRSFENQVVS